MTVNQHHRINFEQHEDFNSAIPSLPLKYHTKTFLKIPKIGPDSTLLVTKENKIIDSAVHYKNSSAVPKNGTFFMGHSTQSKNFQS